MTKLQQAAARILAVVDLHDATQDPTGLSVPIRVDLLADLANALQEDQASSVSYLEFQGRLDAMTAQTKAANEALRSIIYRSGVPIPASYELRDAVQKAKQSLPDETD